MKFNPVAEKNEGKVINPLIYVKKAQNIFLEANACKACHAISGNNGFSRTKSKREQKVWTAKMKGKVSFLGKIDLSKTFEGKCISRRMLQITFLW